MISRHRTARWNPAERRPRWPIVPPLGRGAVDFPKDAGASLLHHAGARRAGVLEILPDDAELRTASSEVDGHALALLLLGRFLHRAHLGDIRRRDLVEFHQADPLAALKLTLPKRLCADRDVTDPSALGLPIERPPAKVY